MIERIGAISNQLSGAVNIVAERDMSEKDETYEFLEAHEVLRDMRRQLEVAQGLDAELEKFRWEIPPGWRRTMEFSAHVRRPLNDQRRRCTGCKK
ncbi:hypothetical protein ERJ75_001146800 [Trypanosoma vivax]|nr:hypothetical protein ERJ75_001146800 [Trypanosoma vivax]